jgi:hypothetical protein
VELLYLGEKIRVVVSLVTNTGRSGELLVASQQTFRGQQLPRVGDAVSILVPPEGCILVEGGRTNDQI